MMNQHVRDAIRQIARKPSVELVGYLVRQVRWGTVPEIAVAAETELKTRLAQPPAEENSPDA